MQRVQPPNDFLPNVLIQELDRAIILGNPPRRPTEYRVTPPQWLTRPPEIPPSYPMRRNNGETFLPD
jgi:hypothetical protein